MRAPGKQKEAVPTEENVRPADKAHATMHFYLTHKNSRFSPITNAAVGTPLWQNTCPVRLTSCGGASRWLPEGLKGWGAGGVGYGIPCPGFPAAVAECKAQMKVRYKVSLMARKQVI